MGQTYPLNDRETFWEMAETELKRYRIISSNLNIFRLVADFSRLFGIMFLICYVVKKKSCVGISIQTQFLYFLVVLTRYVDIFSHFWSYYNTLFKISKIKMDLDAQMIETISCKICWLPYTHEKRAPISLRCGHTLCRMCIGELTNAKNHVPCGICREKTWIEPKKLVKNYELIRKLSNRLEFLGMLEYFGHLQEESMEPVLPLLPLAQEDQVQSQNGQEPSRDQPLHLQEQQEPLQDHTIQSHEQQEQPEDQQLQPQSEQNQIANGIAHPEVPIETHRIPAPGIAEPHDNDLNLGEVNQLLHRIREAIATIQNEGDILQVFAIENQDKLEAFSRRISTVFTDVRKLLAHPLRVEVARLVERFYRSRPTNVIVNQVLPEDQSPEVNRPPTPIPRDMFRVEAAEIIVEMPQEFREAPTLHDGSGNQANTNSGVPVTRDDYMLAQPKMKNDNLLATEEINGAVTTALEGTNRDVQMAIEGNDETRGDQAKTNGLAPMAQDTRDTEL